MLVAVFLFVAVGASHALSTARIARATLHGKGSELCEGLFGDVVGFNSDAGAPLSGAYGFKGLGIEVTPEKLEELAAAHGSEVQKIQIAASLIPDEDPTAEVYLTFADLKDEQGYPIAAVSGAGIGPKIVLGVTDLDASIDFYTRCLGMRLIRKRSLVPDVAAFTAFVGYTDEDEDVLARSTEGADPKGTPRIELRYDYNNDKVTVDGLSEILIQCDEPQACADQAVACGGDVVKGADWCIRDPDGYPIRLESL